MSTSLRSVALLLLVSTIAMSACGHQTISYVDRGSTYTTHRLREVLERTSAGATASTERADAVDLRHKALVELRGFGLGASRAADLITRTFPATTPSVPVYVERATVNGTVAYVIVEAWGRQDGHLSARRLWALDARSGQVLFSASEGSGR